MYSGIFCIITVLVPDDAVLETLIIFLISKTMISASFLIIYPFAGELYPTQVRGVGIGTSSYIGGMGLIFIPFINYLVSISFWKWKNQIKLTIWICKGKRKSSSSTCCHGFHINFRWYNWLEAPGNFALSPSTDSWRGRRIWKRLGYRGLLPMHSDKVNLVEK